MSDSNLFVILGATAVGKTKLAVEVAAQYQGEIISADSRQVYRGMDIGTGKDLSDYQLKNQTIPYHLIDIIDAGENYHVHAFKNDFYRAFENITRANKLPILCGGTGMYIHSLLQNHQFTAIPVNESLRAELTNCTPNELLDRLSKFPKVLRQQSDTSTRKRTIRAIEIADFLSKNEVESPPSPQLSPLVIGLHTEVETRRKRILSRLKQRLNQGLIEEVQQLLKTGVSEEKLIFYGLEYKFVVAYLQGKINFDELSEQLGTAICQFAKRQMTFFRKMEKDGVQINWITADDDLSRAKSEVFQLINLHFKQK
jgi:tRNA dimethylallyltransferase